MSRYSKICPECGSHSDGMDEECAECGAIKVEYLFGLGFFESIFKYFTNQFHLSKSAQFIIFSASNLIGIFLIGFIFSPNSFFGGIFTITYTIYAIVHIVLSLEHLLFNQELYLSKAIRIITLAYFGAGLGLILHYTGRVRYVNLIDFFDPQMIYWELNNGQSGIMILGSFIVIATYFFIRYSFRDLLDSNH